MALAGFQAQGVDSIRADGDPLTGDVEIQAGSGISVAVSGQSVQVIGTGTPTPAPSSEYNAGNSGASKTISWAAAVAQRVTLTADCVFSFSGAEPGASYWLRIIQPAQARYNFSLPSSVLTPQGSVTPLIQTENETLLEIYYNSSSQYNIHPVQNYPRSYPISVVPYGMVSVIDSQAQAWVWGYNVVGSAGNQTTSAIIYTPSQLHPTRQIRKWLSANSASIILEAFTNRVFTTGNNASGQLGNNSTTNQSTFTALAGPPKTFSDIAAGNSFMVALEYNTGRVWTWGSNTNGALGDNSTTARSSPVTIAGPSTRQFIRVYASTTANFAAALEQPTGRPYTWGLNTNGQLGDNSTTTRSSPVSVNSALSFVQMALGAAHMLAISGADGRVYAWGLNTFGQLGDGTTTTRSAPTLASQVTASMIQVAAGSCTSYGLDSTGTIWAWGNNQLSGLGLNSGASLSYSSAVTISGGRKFLNLGCSQIANSDMVLAVEQTTGALYGWGVEPSRQVWGQNFTEPTTPVFIALASSFSKVQAASSGGFALDSVGRVLGWGINANSELLLGSTNYQEQSPVTLATGGRSFSDLALAFSGSGGTGAATSFAGAVIQKTTGDLYTFGTADAFLLGRDPSSSFGTINIAASFTRVASGSRQFFAIDAATGRIYSWGYGANGRLGDNTTTNRSVPGLIARTASYSKVAGLPAGGLAIDASNGTGWAWGLNSGGALGDASFTTRSSPVSVHGGRSYIQVAGSRGSTSDPGFAIWLQHSGILWASGTNANGQLGNNSTSDENTPVSVHGGRSYVDVACGGSFAVAVEAGTGRLWAWGTGASGELGIGVSTDKLTPVSVFCTSSFVQVAAGLSAGYAVEGSTGAIFAWGSHIVGQLGDGYSTNYASPVSIGRVFY